MRNYAPTTTALTAQKVYSEQATRPTGHMRGMKTYIEPDGEDATRGRAGKILPTRTDGVREAHYAHLLRPATRPSTGRTVSAYPH